MKVYLIYSSEPYEEPQLLEIKDSEEKAKVVVEEYEKDKEEEKIIEEERFILNDKRSDFCLHNNCYKRKLTYEEEEALDDLFVKRCMSEREKYVFNFVVRYLGNIYYSEWEVT